MNSTSSLREYLGGMQGTFPHVFVVFGDKEKSLDDVFEYLKADRGLEPDNHPDIFSFDSKQFGIPEARSVTKVTSRKNIESDLKFITIQTDAITIEAQNALLKTIEEPSSPTVFFILLPEGAYLLDTALSRSHVVRVVNEDDSYQAFTKSFLESNFAERIELLEQFSTEVEGKSVYQKDQIVLWLSGMERVLGQKVLSGEFDKQKFDDFLDIKKYILDRSANVKQILEFVALRV